MTASSRANKSYSAAGRWRLPWCLHFPLSAAAASDRSVWATATAISHSRTQGSDLLNGVVSAWTSATSRSTARAARRARASSVSRRRRGRPRLTPPWRMISDVRRFHDAIARFLPRCMECRRGLTMRFLSVRPSVCQTRALWQNGR